MLPARMLPHTITIQTPGTTTDAYGNEVKDWATATTRVIQAYVRPLDPDGEEHPEAGRDVSDRSWRVSTNDMAVTATDRAVWQGVTYDIDGDPLVWPSAPGGRLSKARFKLRRVDG